MGAALTQCAHSAFDAVASLCRPRFRVLILGLDCAGKTTLLYKLKLGETIVTSPTDSFNVETFYYKNIEFTAWDLGGQSLLRPLWKTHYPGCVAAIYVVDSADRSRVELAAHELRNVFEYEELKDAKLLVFANKQDLPGCMKTEELEEKLHLSTVTKNAHHIEEIVAITGEGVYEGLDWLSNAIVSKDNTATVKRGRSGF